MKWTCLAQSARITGMLFRKRNRKQPVLARWKSVFYKPNLQSDIHHSCLALLIALGPTPGKGLHKGMNTAVRDHWELF